MSTLLEDLLSKPVGKPVTNAPADDATTRSIEVDSRAGTATITLPIEKGSASSAAQGTALTFLKEEGQNPDEWEVTNFKKISYGNPQSPFESIRFTYRKRTTQETRQPLDIDDLIRRAKKAKPPKKTSRGSRGIIFATADWQIAKSDADGVEGTLARVFACIDEATEHVKNAGGAEHILAAFVGDLLEGFVSQNGANVWRTNLTLGEQVRIARRIMHHVMEQFAPHCNKLTMACAPGNHDQSQRINGTGVTRYDDSHDVECLIAVHDAAKYNEQAYGHVEFLVPENDSLTVVTDIAGARVGLHHGHMFKPGRGHEWWQGQAYGNGPLRDATLLITGHYHHFSAIANGHRLWVQLPAMEKESTWYKHRTGVTGDPGMAILEIENGEVASINQIRGNTRA